MSLVQTRPDRTWVSRHVGWGKLVIFQVEGVIFDFFADGSKTESGQLAY